MHWNLTVVYSFPNVYHFIFSICLLFFIHVIDKYSNLSSLHEPILIKINNKINNISEYSYKIKNK